MKRSTVTFCFAAFLTPLALTAQSYVIVSLEEFNVQNSASTVTLQEANFYAEVGNVANVNSATVGAATGSLYNTGPLVIPPDGSDFVYKQSHPTVGEMLTQFPSDGVYSISLNTTSGSFSANHIAVDMKYTYADYRPVAPLFTISGVSGTWFTPAVGPTQFRFTPSADLSFTVTLNSYTASRLGGHYAYSVKTRDLLDGGDERGGVGGGPFEDSVAFTPPVFTFTYGAAGNGTDTYGFVEGSSLAVEAAFYNIVGLMPAGTPSAWGDPYAEVSQGFFFGNETQLLLVAIPEAATVPFWLAVAALGLAATRRRR